MLASQGYRPQHPSRASNRPWAYQQACASANLPEVPVRLHFPGAIKYEKSAGNIELGLTSQNFNFTDFDATNLDGVNVIELRNTKSNIVSPEKSDLERLNDKKQLLVRMEKDDRIITKSRWSSIGGQMVGDRWVQFFQSGSAIRTVLSEREWRNEANRYDVDGDASLNPLDVLVLINRINSLPAASEKIPARTGTSPVGFYDPNGDAFLDPLDVLMLINRINSEVSLRGEGESATDSLNSSPANFTARDAALAQLSYMPDWDIVLSGPGRSSTNLESGCKETSVATPLRIAFD